MREDEFDVFAAVAYPRMWRVAYAWCHDTHRAEDLTQGALERVFASWSRIRPGEDAYAYARKTLINLAVSESRRRRWRRELLSDQVAEVAAPGADVDLALDTWSAVRALPPRQRAVVVLRFLEDLPVAEVAAILGCSEGTVKSQSSDALRTLRGRLAGDATTAGATP